MQTEINPAPDREPGWAACAKQVTENALAEFVKAKEKSAPKLAT